MTLKNNDSLSKENLAKELGIDPATLEEKPDKGKTTKIRAFPRYFDQYVDPDVRANKEWRDREKKILQKYSEDKHGAYVLIANLILEKIDFLCLLESKELFWNNPETGTWIKDSNKIDRNALVEAVCHKINPKFSKNAIKEIIAKVSRQTFKAQDVFEQNKHLIALKNGVFDLKNMKKLVFSPNHFLLSSTSIKYDLNAKCPAIMSFIRSLVKEEQVQTVLEMIGYCFWNDYHINTVFFLLGEGSNGKSTFTELLGIFLGKNNVSSNTLHQLVGEKYRKAELRGKLANISSENPEKGLYDTTNFKALSGGDRISARPIYGEPIEFKNTAKLIFACNRLPPFLYDNTEAVHRRPLIIDFPNKFEKEDRNFVSRHELLKKLTTEEEMSGLFNLAEEALRKLLERGGFIEPTTEEKKKRWLFESDPLEAFLEYYCEQREEAWIPVETLYNHFKKHFRLPKGLETQRKFVRKVNKRFPDFKSHQKTIDGERCQVFEELHYIGEFHPKVKKMSLDEVLLEGIKRQS